MEGHGIPTELFQILKEDTIKVLYSICQQIWKISSDHRIGKKSVCIPVPKKDNAKECWNKWTFLLIPHTSKVMFKILQAKLQQYVNCELIEVKAGFQQHKWTRIQIANIHWIMEKAREFQTNIFFCFICFWLWVSQQNVENS